MTADWPAEMLMESDVVATTETIARILPHCNAKSNRYEIIRTGRRIGM